MHVEALPHPSTEAPPAFVRLIAHPIRWRLLRELVVSDRAVWELAQLVDEPQNLVSYHLRLLREEGLVFARRSAADRRDTFYAIDLVSCAEWLQTSAAAPRDHWQEPCETRGAAPPPMSGATPRS